MTDRYLPGDNPAFLARQLITYLGNKRALLEHIDGVICDVRDALGGRKLACADLFSGSGVVARLLKRHAHILYVNDLEGYSAILNRCYLTNKADFPEKAYEIAFAQAQKALETPVEGILSRNYAPADDENIQPGNTLASFAARMASAHFLAFANAALRPVVRYSSVNRTSPSATEGNTPSVSVSNRTFAFDMELLPYRISVTGILSMSP